MPAASASKTVVIIVNTGSPAAPTKEALAQYLLEFLGDRRVVELNPWIWQPILRGIIIPRRSEASAQRYKTVWTKDGSPLMAISAKTAAAMQKALGEAFCVSWAMCYGTHRVAEVIAKAAQAAPERIVILPMFAQYATQTTEAVYDAVDRAVKKNPIGSEILRIRSYHNHPLYIEALAAGVRRHWEQAGALGEKGKVLMSFHGIPQASSDRGDPYEAQCKQTAALLAQKLGLKDEEELQGYFNNKIAVYLQRKGKRMIGWNEILKAKNLENSVIAEYWTPTNDPEVQEYLEQGKDVVIAKHQAFYFDMPYAQNRLKTTYEFTPEKYGLKSENGGILGVEGALWTEWVSSDERIWFQLFPRMQALSEVAWTDEKLRHYRDFAKRLKRMLPLFDKIGLGYCPVSMWNAKNPFKRAKTMHAFYKKNAHIEFNRAVLIQKRRRYKF